MTSLTASSNNPRTQSATVPAEGHTTVLLQEAVDFLKPRAGGIYVDGTFGGGGHSRAILHASEPNGRVLAIDADPAAQKRASAVRSELANPEWLQLVHGNFRNLEVIVHESGVGAVDGVLLDLGLSSFQLDQEERGFSFRFDAPLDMRFDITRGMSAADLVNEADQDELARIMWEYGDERQSRRIAVAIVRARADAPIRTTGELAQLIERVVGGRRNAPIHPATRTFQALRIAVNDELAALREVLAAAVKVLGPGGRLVVISFHSLEDRIVKRFIDDESRTCVCPPEQPVCTCDTIPRLAKIGKPVRPSEQEQQLNPRSRSAIMRIAERLDARGEFVQQGHDS
jgi:16S rRNA (cytosine1402-N4)-methyltransferase